MVKEERLVSRFFLLEIHLIKPPMLKEEWNGNFN